MVLQINSDTKEPREFALSGAPETWSQEIIGILEALDKEDEEAKAQA